MATYSTNFPNTENPLSSGGSWTNGSAGGLLAGASDMQSTPNFAFGTQDPATQGDSVACLTGLSWTKNQTVTGVAKIAVSGLHREIELHTNMVIFAGVSPGVQTYEYDIEIDGVVNIIRWNNIYTGDFTVLTGPIGVTAISDGDTIIGQNTNGSLVLKINGTQQASATDSTYTGGSPGIGWFASNGFGGANTDMGWKSWTAVDDAPVGPQQVPYQPQYNLSPMVAQ